MIMPRKRQYHYGMVSYATIVLQCMSQGDPFSASPLRRGFARQRAHDPPLSQIPRFLDLSASSHKFKARKLRVRVSHPVIMACLDLEGPFKHSKPVTPTIVQYVAYAYAFITIHNHGLSVYVLCDKHMYHIQEHSCIYT